MWVRWDSQWYLHIAAGGYQGVREYAFSPLYPFLIWLFTPEVGSGAMAGLVLSNVAFLGALVWLQGLVREEWGVDVARRTTDYLILFPFSFYFSAVYTESLFLLFTVVSFAAARRRNWMLAGLAGLGASLTRSVGMVLVLPLLYEFWRSRERWAKSWRIGLVFVGPAIFALYQYFREGDPFLFLQAQRIGWDRVTTWPWVGFVAAFKQMATHPYPAYSQVITVLDLSSSLLFLALILWMIFRFPPAYALYSGAAYLLSVTAPSLGAVSPLLSMSRLVLVLFPAFIVLGVLGKRESVNRLLVITAPVIQGCAFAVFSSWHWLA